MSDSQLTALLGAADRHKGSVVDFVVDALRAPIIRGDLPGGTRLLQADIARQLGVSTTPVREALRQLASEGLLQFDAHRGAVVRSLDLGELAEVYEIRVRLDPLAMERLAENPDDSALAHAEELQDKMDAEDDLDRWAALNREFHSTLTEACGNRRLAAMLNGLHAANVLYVGWSLRTDVDPTVNGNRDHRMLLEALRAGRPEDAGRIAERHVGVTLERLRTDQASQLVPNEKVGR